MKFPYEASYGAMLTLTLSTASMEIGVRDVAEAFLFKPKLSF